MNGQRQPILLTGLIDRVIPALAERRARSGVRHDLYEVRVSCPPRDLSGRCQWILVCYRDRALEDAVAVVLRQPRRRQPLVIRSGDGGAEVGIRMQVTERARQEDRVGDAVLVYDLPAQQVGIGTRRSTGWRPTVEPGTMDGILEESASTASIPVPPGHWHVRLDLLHASWHRMDIAVHNTFTSNLSTRYLRLGFYHDRAPPLPLPGLYFYAQLVSCTTSGTLRAPLFGGRSCRMSTLSRQLHSQYTQDTSSF